MTKFLWIICLYELELSNSRTQNIQFATTSYVPTFKTTKTDLAIGFAGYCTICGYLSLAVVMNFFSYAWVVLREGKKAILYSTCHVSACSLLPLLLLTRPSEHTANIFEVIFTVFNCVPISTVILLYGVHFIAAPSTV